MSKDRRMHGSGRQLIPVAVLASIGLNMARGNEWPPVNDRGESPLRAQATTVNHPSMPRQEDLSLQSLAEEGEIVVIGDSGAFGLAHYLSCPLTDTIVEQRAVGGSTAGDWAQEAFLLEQLEGTNPRYVVAWMGLGDVLQSYFGNAVFTIDEWIDLFFRLTRVCRLIHQFWPQAEIIFINYADLRDGCWMPPGIPLGPGGLWDSAAMNFLFAQTLLYNLVIDWAAAWEDAQVIDIYPVFRHHGYGRYLFCDRAPQEPMYFYDLSDGLDAFHYHPSPEGFQAVVSLLQPIICDCAE